MSEADDNPAADVGVALLLGGGVAEAIASIEATLATVRDAAGQVLAGLARVQAVGAAAAAVPPAPAQRAATLPETAIASTLAVRPEEQFVPPRLARPAGPEQMAALAPISAPDDHVQASAPIALAERAPASGVQAAPAVSAAPANSAGCAAGLFTRCSGTAASFAPVPSRAAGAASAADPRAAEPPQSVGLWGASTPERTQPGSVSPAAPMATPDGGGVAPRAFAPPAAPSAQGGGPTGGDVFLMGTRVGSLDRRPSSREAGRPQAGGTAFDPRLSPAWPGTLQGN